METAVQIAIIAAGTAITIFAVVAVVVLGYSFYILRHVHRSLRQFKRTATDIASDVKGALKTAIGVSSRSSKG